MSGGQATIAAWPLSCERNVASAFIAVLDNNSRRTFSNCGGRQLTPEEKELRNENKLARGRTETNTYYAGLIVH